MGRCTDCRTERFQWGKISDGGALVFVEMVTYLGGAMGGDDI